MKRMSRIIQEIITIIIKTTNTKKDIGNIACVLIEINIEENCYSGVIARSPFRSQ